MILALWLYAIDHAMAAKRRTPTRDALTTALGEAFLFTIRLYQSSDSTVAQTRIWASIVDMLAARRPHMMSVVKKGEKRARVISTKTISGCCNPLEKKASPRKATAEALLKAMVCHASPKYFDLRRSLASRIAMNFVTIWGCPQ